jgi:phosphate transport system permease protein
MSFSAKHYRRKFTNSLALTLSICAMVFGLFWLGWILFTLLRNALPAMQSTVFSQMTPPPGEKGGLLNAIIGSFMMSGIATCIGTPIGILAGTYLAEIGPDRVLSKITRFINGILLSAPSVVIGFFIYALVVARSGHFSGWAGIAALTVILIPVVVNSTENMLRLVPNSIREAASALGAPEWKVITLIAYRAARSGILTGVLLGVARISGETAPLLFTALNNQFFSSNLAKPMANLPVVIFQFAMSPYDDWQSLAWAGAFLITLSVLALNIIARILTRNKNART